MTYFGQKFLAAVKPNTKIAQTVRLVRVTVRYPSQAAFEKEMARRRRAGVV